MARSATAAKVDVVSEIVALIPKSRSSLPWWERVGTDVAAMLPSILQAWRDGQFGTKRRSAARAISAWLRQRNVEIGEQGVEEWLNRNAQP